MIIKCLLFLIFKLLKLIVEFIAFTCVVFTMTLAIMMAVDFGRFQHAVAIQPSTAWLMFLLPSGLMAALMMLVKYTN